MNKTIVVALWIFVTTTGHAWAEGFASVTSVTKENLAKLRHHQLALTSRSDHGMTHVQFSITTKKEHPIDCLVVRFLNPTNKKVLLAMTPEAQKKGASSAFSISVADSSLDNISVLYELRASQNQVHSFLIDAGQLRAIVSPDANPSN